MSGGFSTVEQNVRLPEMLGWGVNALRTVGGCGCRAVGVAWPGRRAYNADARSPGQKAHHVETPSRLFVQREIPFRPPAGFTQARLRGGKWGLVPTFYSPWSRK